MKPSIALWALAVSARPNYASSDTDSATQPSITPTPAATAVLTRRDGLTSIMSDFPGTPMCDTTIVLTAGIHTTVVMPLPCSDLTTSTTAAGPTQAPASTSAAQTRYDFTGTTWSLSSLSTTSYGIVFPTPTFDPSAMPYPTSMFPKSKTSGGGSSVATSAEMMLDAAAMHDHNHASSTTATQHNRFTDRVCGSTKVSLTQGVHTTIWMPLPCTTTEPAAFETSSVCSKLVTLTAGIHTVLTMPYPCHESGALHPITFSAPPSRDGMLVEDRTSFVTLLRTVEATA